MNKRAPIRRVPSLLLTPLVLFVAMVARPANGQDIFVQPPPDKFSTITLQDFSLLDSGFANLVGGGDH